MNTLQSGREGDGNKREGTGKISKVMPMGCAAIDGRGEKADICIR